METSWGKSRLNSNRWISSEESCSETKKAAEKKIVEFHLPPFTVRLLQRLDLTWEGVNRWNSYGGLGSEVTSFLQTTPGTFTRILSMLRSMLLLGHFFNAPFSWICCQFWQICKSRRWWIVSNSTSISRSDYQIGHWTDSSMDIGNYINHVHEGQIDNYKVLS